MINIKLPPHPREMQPTKCHIKFKGKLCQDDKIEALTESLIAK